MANVNINVGEITSVRLNEQGSDVSTPAAGYWSLYTKADGLYVIDDAGAVSQAVLMSAIQASQLVNEIKGWPPVVNTGDLDALNLWWDKVGTPSTAPSVVAVSGEGGVTETWERCLKVVTDEASEGLSQTWTYADEPRLKVGRKLSALLAIWSVSSVEVTAKLVNSDASETAAAAVTAAAWTVVEIPNHTLAGTTCALTVTAGAAGTFYVVPLGANIGARGFPLPPRPSRYVSTNARVVNGADSGATYQDVDCTASTSPLCWAVNLWTNAYNPQRTCTMYVRRNGSTSDIEFNFIHATSQFSTVIGVVDVDDGQIYEYKQGSQAGDSEQNYHDIHGWWEWA